LEPVRDLGGCASADDPELLVRGRVAVVEHVFMLVEFGRSESPPPQGPVMAPVESPADPDRWPHPQERLLALILITCGVGSFHACTLALGICRGVSAAGVDR
jgi:hypothetical protein